MPKKIKVQILTITHQYGTNFYAAKTKKGIKNQLFTFVKLYWETEMETEMPKDQQQAIDEYFGEMGNHGESYELGESDLNE